MPSRQLLTRRDFVQSCAMGTLAYAIAPILRAQGTNPVPCRESGGPASRIIPLDHDWLFGGKFTPVALAGGLDDSAWECVSLPHTVARLGWKNWDPAAWQDVWAYRRHFKFPDIAAGHRVFLHFEGVMVGAAPTINHHPLPRHFGGYLPFHHEITEWLCPGDNVLAVAVDSRWSQVPPEGSPHGAAAVDFLEPGGMLRPARLEIVPQTFIADVFARPVQVLTADRRLDVTCTLDASAAVVGTTSLRVELQDGTHVLSRTEQAVSLMVAGTSEVSLKLENLGNIKLWGPDSPHLYRVVTTLLVAGRAVHDHVTRTGFREARFELDGFFLNGRRLQLFGLNRHELFPYVGFALPRRVMRRDAEILRRDFNCNVVRCSHYPQSPGFLDACDELGLMVFEEMPGWHFIGDSAWQDFAVRDLQDMVRRDRNRPSIILWGARINESANNPPFYERVRTACMALDGSRQTSGGMSLYSTEGWAEDVYAKNDYHAPDKLLAPLDGVPYFLSETVGQFNYDTLKGFDFKYRRAGEVSLQQRQAILHARGHNNAAANPRVCGVIAWCAFDYASLRNSYEGVKCPGVADVFRIPKLGAAFYLTQGDPVLRPVIVPNFHWDFGPNTPRGPGPSTAIFSNCDKLEVFIDGRLHATLLPDAANYPHVKHPPFFTDLEVDGSNRPELRIDGYVAGRLALVRSFSSDPSLDQFVLSADDTTLSSDEPDATRVVFKVVDRHGTARAFAGGVVAFNLSGPGELIGDNPFALADSGGCGAIWIRTEPGACGRITLVATHSALGPRSLRVNVRPGFPVT